MRVSRWLAFLPPVATAVFIALFGTNVPYWDEWDLAPLIGKLAAHQAALADFFQQQSEHRFLFPKLILAPLALATHWNVIVELWLSFAVALVGFAGLMLLMKESDPTARVIASLAYFSLAAYENWLWGWQLSWFLADTLFIWAVIAAMHKRIAAAAILCFAATFSAAFGVISWIALAPLLPRLPRRAFAIGIWAVLFAGSIALYLHRFDWTAGSRVRGSIVDDIAYALTIAGSPMARVPMVAAVLGAMLVALFAIHVRRDPAWFSIGLFAVGFAAINAIGRSGLGISQALTSRYITPGSLLLIAVVNCPPRSRWRAAVVGGLSVVLIAQSAASIPLAWQIKQSRDDSRVCLALMLVNDSSDCMPGLYPNGETLLHDAAEMHRIGIRPLVTPGDFAGTPRARGSAGWIGAGTQARHAGIVATGNVSLPGRGVFAVAATVPDQRRIVAAGLVRGGGDARWSLLFPPRLVQRSREFDLWLFVPDDRRLYPITMLRIAAAGGIP